MRSILLAGVAAVALGSSPALAGPFTIPATGLAFCTATSLVANSTQTQCAVNHVAKPWYGENDDNKQDIDQSQGGELKWGSWGTAQMQLGGNIVVKGDDNRQYLDQHQNIEANYHAGWPAQVQVGASVVVSGDDNKQSIDQSQDYENDSRKGGSKGTSQVQGALNTVMDGDGNEQEITQSQSLKIGGGHGHHGGHND